MDPCKYSVLHEGVCNVLKKFGVDIDKQNEQKESNITSQIFVEEEEPHVCPACTVCSMPSKECSEKVHPYLNQLDSVDEKVLTNTDEIIKVVMERTQPEPKISVKKEEDIDEYILLKIRDHYAHIEEEYRIQK